jgi:RNA polymerase sigma-70 factor (ECF subfamily)
MTEPQAQSLAAAAASGDDDALAAMVRSYHDRVFRYGMRVCRDGYDADDAVQEAFSRLARRPDVVRHQGALAWLMKVVRNTCLRMLRPFLRQRRALGEPIDDPDSITAGDGDPRAALERWELVRAVHAAIATLERPFREILVMRDLEGLSGDETCAALGLTVAAMKTRLHRARSKLREALVAQGVAVSSPGLPDSGARPHRSLEGGN